MSLTIYTPPGLVGSSDALNQRAAYDAFGRLRVSEPATVFDSKQDVDDQAILWATLNTGGATQVWSNTDARTRMTVVGGTDRAVRQSKAYLPYQPGKSQLIFCTFNMNGGAANTTKRAGYFDDSNGIFVELSGASTVNLVRRSGSSVVTQTVPQGSWNLDKMNGTGASGINLNFSTTQIFVIFFEWLGVGSAWCGWVVNGQIYLCHRFDNANSGTAVYMTSPLLPVRYEIVSSGGGSTLDAICSTVISEGGAKIAGQHYSYVNVTSRGPVAASGTLPLISMRVKAATAGNPLLNRVPILPADLSILAAGNNPFAWELILNPTLTWGVPPAWSVTSSPYVDYDVNALTATGGTVIATGLVSGTSRAELITSLENTYIRLGSSVDGLTMDYLTLRITNVGSGNESYFGSLNYLALV